MEDLRVWIPARVVRLKIVVFFLLGETWLVWELASESYYPESPKVTTEASKTIGLLYIQIYKYKNTIRGQILMTIFEHQNKKEIWFRSFPDFLPFSNEQMQSWKIN